LFRLTFAERIAESKVRTQRNARRKFSPSDWLSPYQKRHFTFWIKFGLSLKFGLSKRLSERLIQSDVTQCLNNERNTKNWLSHWPSLITFFIDHWTPNGRGFAPFMPVPAASTISPMSLILTKNSLPEEVEEEKPRRNWLTEGSILFTRWCQCAHPTNTLFIESACGLLTDEETNWQQALSNLKTRQS